MSTLEYTRRFNRVLDHIDLHLDQTLELADLADIAHFSRFHFHRVFAAWIGETLGDYLRRRRLEMAAMRLAAYPQQSILDIALSVGFGSAEAFARPFKTRFGCTPSAWRASTRERWATQLANARSMRNPEESGLNLILSNPDQDGLPHGRDTDTSSTNREYQMNVEIKDLPSVTIAYLRYIGPYGPQCNEFWRTQALPWLRENQLITAPRYGISLDDPSITAPANCRYDACAEVPAGFKPSAPGGLARLPGGRYAVAHFSGTSAHIEGAWTEMFRAWLPESGLQCDERPCFEYYPSDAKYDLETGIFECDLCIPVRPL